MGRWRGDARQHLGGDGADVAVPVAEGSGGDAFDGVDVFASMERVQECQHGVHPHLVFGCPAPRDLRFLPGRIGPRQQALYLRQRRPNRLADCAQGVERLARHLAVRAVERRGQRRRRAPRGRPDFAEGEGGVDLHPRVFAGEQVCEGGNGIGAARRQRIGGVFHHHGAFVPAPWPAADVVPGNRPPALIHGQGAFMPALAGMNKQGIDQCRHIAAFGGAVDALQARRLIGAVEAGHRRR